MLWTATKRIIKAGFINFWRNGFVSLASVLVMTVTLTVIGLIIFTGALFSASLVQLRDKVDINVYFVTSAPENDILSLKLDLEQLPEVKKVEYFSRDDVLARFKARHENDQLTLQALEELGENPLGATLNIAARETSQYESIVKFLETKNAGAAGSASIISKINYYDNKSAIENLNNIITSGQRIGSFLVLIFGLISILITFNTIQLVIYTAREEISVMRLVGASTAYIRGPFVVTGIMYGVVAAFVTIILLYCLALWLAPSTTAFFGDINLASYYLSRFLQIFGIIFGAGIVLGAISSYLAVRRYLIL
jgi:cell division transport system permease protein